MSTDNSQGRWEFDENGNVSFVSQEEGTEQPTVDGSYHYSYRSSTTRNTSAASGSKSDDGWHWILIVLGFMVAWPIGLILLFLQLGGRWPGSKQLNKEFKRASEAAKNMVNQVKAQTTQSRQSQPGNYGQTTAQVQERLARERAQRAQAAQKARQEQVKAQAEAAAKKAASQDPGKPYGLGNVRLFRWIGGVIAGLFGFAFVVTLIDELTYFISLPYLLNETLPLLALMLIGVTLIAMAGSRKRKLKKFQKYMTMVGNRDLVSIEALAKAMGVSEKKAEKDLEEMLERDFWDEGYVDAARRALVLGGPLREEPQPEIDQEVPADEDSTADLTLRHIREVNDAIADTDMSDKIFRIEELTGKIFKLLEERPEKAKELRSFMNYYLPQTLKILENYAKLEAQGIEGENITEAKAKIEGMMDKLVDGYETQLDKLFADDVLDISADVKVMEQMLEKDGLAMENEMRF